MNWLIAQTEPPGTNFWAIPRTDGSLFSQQAFMWVLGALVGTVVFLLVLSRVPSNFRKPITVGVTFLAGMFYVLEWILPRGRTATGEPTAPLGPINFTEVIPIVSSISQILTGMLLALGVLSIFRVHFGRLFKMQKDWFFSAVLLFSMFVMVILGMINFMGDLQVRDRNAAIALAMRKAAPGTIPMTDEWSGWAKLGINQARNDMFEAKFLPAQRLYGQKNMSKEDYDAAVAKANSDADAFATTESAKVDAAVSGTLPAADVEAVLGYVTSGATVDKERRATVQGFNLLFEKGLLAMDAAMFSLIGFFILSAAYRAFRIRSIEASILMATALVVLLMFVPIALMLTNGLDPNSFAGNFRIDTIGMWLLSTVNVPAIRAIDLGLGLGLLAMALRIMLGLERGVASE